MIGKTLAHYEILGLLGRGGMGEVYRSRDTKLDREVALKLLPPQFAEDAERLARFRREARTLASLHHPNVAAVFGLEDVEGHVFLVMELAEGEDLADRLERGPLPWEDAVEIARHIASGLEEAHAKGIVHRDLKPSNVKITPTGQVKILDFGLARAFTGESVTEENDPSTSPTITAAMTQAGTVLGTAAYMSPEQARGKPVDQRADIWAFGVLLWEMLLGRRLFEGETTSDTLANVLKHSIELAEVPRDTPAGVRRVLARCLARDPRQRLHAIADARIELENLEATTTGPERPTTGRSSRLPWLLAGTFLLACLVLAWRPWQAEAPARLEPLAVAVTLPDDMELALIDWPALAVSENGQTLALTARVDGRTTVIFRPLARREIHSPFESGNSLSVFFSPDGRWLGYYSESQLMKVSVDGGAPVKITQTAHPRGTSWGDDGYVYFSPEYSTGIHRVRDSGDAEPEVLTEPDPDRFERTHRWPDALPGGRGAVFTVGFTNSPGDYEDAEIAVYDAARDETRYLGVKGALARYSPTGHLLVMRNGVLHATRFDLGSLEVKGTPEPVLEGIRGDPSSGMYYFDIDGQGNIYYVAAQAGGPQRRLVWIDREGNAKPLDLPAGRYRYPDLHPDGNRVVLVLGEGHGNNDDVYLMELDDLNLTRVTFDQTSIMPKWMPSGDALVFQTSAPASIRLRDMGRSATTRTLGGLRGIMLPSCVGADGRTVLATRLGAKTLGDIWAFDTEDSTRSGPVLETPAAEWGAMFSPDQKWIVYCSDETGREQIFLQPYPTTGAKWQISTEGGRAPRWSDDGREVFYVLGDRFYSAAIEIEPSVRMQRPMVLFEHRMDSSGVPLANYDVTADGQRFLVVEPDATSGTGRVELILGWAATLAALEP